MFCILLGASYLGGTKGANLRQNAAPAETLYIYD
jgi:hypothetical protein